MKINIITNPKGTFHAVGFSLPLDLCYRAKDGGNLTRQEAAQLHIAGPGFCTRFAKRVTWVDAQAAQDDILGRYPNATVEES